MCYYLVIAGAKIRLFFLIDKHFRVFSLFPIGYEYRRG